MSLVWGVLGGLGPLASNAFLRSIYSTSVDQEQNFPNLILASIPSIIDRSEAIVDEQSKELAVEIEHHLNKLVKAGASRLVICCYSAYCVADLFCHDIQSRLVNLPSLATQMIAATSGKTLILSSLGSWSKGLFGKDSCDGVVKNVVIPSQKDAMKIHEIIYKLKKGHDLVSCTEELIEIGETYYCDSWLLGCSELHMIVDEIKNHKKIGHVDILDPLEETRRLIQGI